MAVWGRSERCSLERAQVHVCGDLWVSEYNITANWALGSGWLKGWGRGARPPCPNVRKNTAKVPYGRKNMIKCRQGHLSSEQNVVKCSLGCPSIGQNEVVCPPRCSTTGKNLVVCPLGCPSSGQNMVKCPKVPFEWKNVLKRPLGCLSIRQNMVKCPTTFGVLVPNGK